MKTYVTVNKKGGVGKTTTSVALASALYFNEKNFRLIEIDNDVNSILYSNSSFINSQNSKSIKTNDKGEIVADIMFDTASEEDLNYIIDIGAGDNVNQVIDSFKSMTLDKTWLIPVTSDKKYLINGVTTYKLIDDPENTYFVLNKVHDIKKIKEEFLYLFGSEKMGIEPVDKIFKKAKFLLLPDSNFYQVAEDDEMTLLDLAEISITKTQDEIRREFFEIAKGDREVFHNLWMSYEKSVEAEKVWKIINNSLKELF
jgi:MinD-like ATPase involved in chromosome partitioning or flagellar assembly